MLKKETWKTWEKSVLEIFSTALLELTSRESLPDKENELNRLLAQIVRECRRKWCIFNGRELPGLPFYQVKGQPDSGDAMKQPKENKVPDFTWGFTDYLNNADKNYHVECKRLGENKYHYCKEYVTHGIKRFVEKEWSYGCGCESGLMIGYIQDMEFEDILHWVNHYAQKHSLPSLTLKDRWKKKSTNRLENWLNRPEVPVSLFKLVHLWADLR